jgi:hypothetical protein
MRIGRTGADAQAGCSEGDRTRLRVSGSLHVGRQSSRTAVWVGYRRGAMSGVRHIASERWRTRSRWS